MVRIRFRRVGARNQPSYRIVAADKESPRDGRFLENLGHYNPRTEPSTIIVDEARLFHWLEHGAQPSDSVRKALNPLGIWDRWERYKAGEDLNTLLEEAEANKIDVDPRTRRDDLFSARSAKKAAAKKEKAAKEETKAAEEPEEEPAEADVEEEKVAEEPAEVEVEDETTEEEPAEVEEEAPEEAETEAEPEEEESEAPEETAEEDEEEQSEDSED
jgi:small subunit ribosomal protein S16